MLKKVLLGTSLLFFTACSQNNAYRFFQKDGIYSENIRFTQHAQTIKDDKIFKIFYVSYVSGYLDEYENSETFLVGLYRVDGKEVDLNNYFFSLNNDIDFELQPLNKEQKKEFIDNIELNNYWAEYFFVKFKKTKYVYKFDFKISLHKIVKQENYELPKDVNSLYTASKKIIPDATKMENFTPYNVQINNKFPEGADITLTFEK